MGILTTTEKTGKWTLGYDVCTAAAVTSSKTTDETTGIAGSLRRVNSNNTSPQSAKSESTTLLGQQQHINSQISIDLDADVEEFFFNLNLNSAANAFNEVILSIPLNP